MIELLKNGTFFSFLENLDKSVFVSLGEIEAILAFVSYPFESKQRDTSCFHLCLAFNFLFIVISALQFDFSGTFLVLAFKKFYLCLRDDSNREILVVELG